MMFGNHNRRTVRLASVRTRRPTLGVLPGIVPNETAKLVRVHHLRWVTTGCPAACYPHALMVALGPTVFDCLAVSRKENHNQPKDSPHLSPTGRDFIRFNYSTSWDRVRCAKASAAPSVPQLFNLPGWRGRYARLRPWSTTAIPCAGKRPSKNLAWLCSMRRSVRPSSTSSQHRQTIYDRSLHG